MSKNPDPTISGGFSVQNFVLAKLTVSLVNRTCTNRVSLDTALRSSVPVLLYQVCQILYLKLYLFIHMLLQICKYVRNFVQRAILCKLWSVIDSHSVNNSWSSMQRVLMLYVNQKAEFHVNTAGSCCMQIVSQQGRPWWLRFADEYDNIEKLQTAELNLSFLCKSINMRLLVIEQYSPNLGLVIINDKGRDILS